MNGLILNLFNMIYLAGPYAHPDPLIMEERFEWLTAYAAQLMAKNILVYSPITHNHPIVIRYSLPRNWEWWERFNIPILMKCSCMHILMLEGWDKSTGVTAERKFCNVIRLPVYFINPVDYTDSEEPYILCPPTNNKSSTPLPST